MKQKDTEYNKGQKILAAVYLVSAHLSDNDPLKQALRSAAIAMIAPVAVSGQGEKRTITQLSDLLGAAVLAGMISEKNASIIILESGYFVRDLAEEGQDTAVMATLESMFTPAVMKPQVTYVKSGISQVRPIGEQYQTAKSVQSTAPQELSNSTKNDRQGVIVNFINERKSASIKDIVTLFPNVSEKTVQRELTTLVSNGSITKRGEKRWSVYMSVSVQ